MGVVRKHHCRAATPSLRTLLLAPPEFPLTPLVRVTSHGGRAAGWFGKDLNNSRLDLFYWLLACIGIANLVFYVVVATRYSYKTVMAGGKVVDDKAGDIECAAAAAAAY
uniref:Uncharacterized protein n=1 Tax=Oryza nivara TaxID=4536 RepID=A0A0E0GIH8_ORYNI